MTESIDPQASAGLWAALVFLWFAASVVYRRLAGKPIFARSGRGAAFAEGWASGRAGTGIVARMSTARNCLQVRVEQGMLRIHPHFPFSLGFMPELYGMDHVIALSAIRSAIILGGRRAQAVEVVYLGANGEEQVVQLMLRRAEGFIHAVLGPALAAQTPPGTQPTAAPKAAGG